MILSVCMSPSIDVTMELDSLNVGMTNVVKNKTFSLGGKGVNVAIGVSRMGFDSFVTGLMYEENGYRFENALVKENVPFSFAWNKGRVRENYKFIDSRSMLTEINGIGEEITLEKAQEVLLSKGVNRLLLEVRESNFSAIGTYEKSGFARLSIRKGYYCDGENAVVMVKERIDG